METVEKRYYKVCLSCAICITYRAWPGGLNTQSEACCADPFGSCLLTAEEQEMITYALFAKPTSVRSP